MPIIFHKTPYDPRKKNFRKAVGGTLAIGSVLRVDGGRDVYLIDGAKKLRYVNSPEVLFTLGKTFDDVVNISAAEAAQYGYVIGQDPLASLITKENPLIMAPVLAAIAGSGSNTKRNLIIGVVVFAAVALLIWKLKHKGKK